MFIILCKCKCIFFLKIKCWFFVAIWLYISELEILESSNFNPNVFFSEGKKRTDGSWCLVQYFQILDLRFSFLFLLVIENPMEDCGLQLLSLSWSLDVFSLCYCFAMELKLYIYWIYYDVCVSIYICLYNSCTLICLFWLN